jgi:phosphoglucomutase
MDLEQKYTFWTQDHYFARWAREEMTAVKDPEEIKDRIGRNLEFGTGGMRGKLGAGTNRMNIYVIRKLTQGLAEAIAAEGEEAKARGVAIAYDSRHHSTEFALETALVLGTNGIKAYLFDALRPTPVVSYAVRKLGAIAGVMVTASHNPKEYNGYKVYWEDGGQLAPEKADQIVAFIEARADWRIPVREQSQLRALDLLVDVGAEIDEAFLREVAGQMLKPELSRARGGELGIIYTPLHGAGMFLAPEILTRNGYTQLSLVAEQMTADGDFPTVEVPNPEDVAAFDLAIHYGREQNADLLIATDPDADRMGVCSREQSGGYRRFSGNQMGVILEYYILNNGAVPGGKVIKSVVSTALAEKIAESFGVELVNVPVGFKFIAEKIKEMEETGQGVFLLGFEESLGYLTGTYARDKDAILATALAAEAALYYKTEYNMTLADVLEEIFAKYGYYLDDQVAVSFQGFDGNERMAAVMAALRRDERMEYGGTEIAYWDDFQPGVRRDRQGAVSELDFPRMNLLRFALSGGGFVMARPSGTEPKIRFYFCVPGASQTDAEEKLGKIREDFFRPISELLQ